MMHQAPFDIAYRFIIAYYDGKYNGGNELK
jgi:hypothetical protein